jgi:tetratricopeptide (TPR) repeat protein
MLSGLSVNATQHKPTVARSAVSYSVPQQVPPNHHSKAHGRYLVAVLLLVITVAVFWRTQDHGFVWDDGVNVEKNAYLKPVTLSNVARFWRGPFENLYVPLTYTAWSAIAYFARVPAEDDREIKLNPRWFHAANVLIHTFSALAVLVLLQSVVGNDWGAGAGAMLFALHPVQVEPVAWITGLKDVLSGFLSVIAFWQYFVFAADGVSERPTASQSSGTIPVQKTLTSGFVSRRSLHYGLATVAFVLALLAKPAAVVVPLMAWVLDYCVARRSVKQSAISLAPWLLIALPFVIMTKSQQPDNLLTVITPLWERPLVAADALAFYLYKLFFPVWFGPGYARSPDTIFEEGWAYFTWIIPLGAAVAIWCLRRREPWSVAAAGLFIAGLLPVLGLVQFQFQNWSTVADRYLYLSMLGPALALAGLISQQWSKRKWVVIPCIAALLSLAVKTAYQSEIWHNSETLWRYALDIGQDSAVVRSNLGATIVKSKLEEAIYQLRRAVELAPAYADAYYNLGIALAEHGNFAEAVDQYRTVLKLKPNYPNVHHFLAIALVGSGQLDEATKHYRTALEIDPDNVTLHNNFGNLLADRGLLEEAIEQYREVVRINPNYAGAYFNLGLAFEDRGDLDEAARQYTKALQVDPHHANAHNNLAAILFRQGQRKQAIEHFREALRIRPDFPEARLGLSRLLGESGQEKAPGN